MKFVQSFLIIFLSATPTAVGVSSPTSAPTFKGTITGAAVFDKKRHRQGGLCENHCSNHGTCEKNMNCKCFNGLDGQPEWTGPDCSLRTCPRDVAWVSSTAVNRDDMHPIAECSNQGICDTKSGTCSCFPGYDGIACQRTVCPNTCNGRGVCLPLKIIASDAGHVYSKAWDSEKQVGCVCDPGFRGPSCEFQECPSGADPLDGYGNEAGRDCSGRGMCDYSKGQCTCFTGFYGTRCQVQTTLY